MPTLPPLLIKDQFESVMKMYSIYIVDIFFCTVNQCAPYSRSHPLPSQDLPLLILPDMGNPDADAHNNNIAFYPDCGFQHASLRTDSSPEPPHILFQCRSQAYRSVPSYHVLNAVFYIHSFSTRQNHHNHCTEIPLRSGKMLSVHIFFHIGTTLTLLYLILADQTAKHRRICLLIIGKILELLCRLIKCQLLIFHFLCRLIQF